MVTDKIENASYYYRLGSRFQYVLKYLAKTDLRTFNPGSYVFNKDSTTVKISIYTPRESETCKA